MVTIHPDRLESSLDHDRSAHRRSREWTGIVPASHGGRCSICKKMKERLHQKRQDWRLEKKWTPDHSEFGSQVATPFEVYTNWVLRPSDQSTPSA